MIRGIGQRAAVAVNVAGMVGAGPLITIPLIVGALHGSLSLWPWIAGAAIALCDGLVNAELASRYPRSGGTYVFLRKAFGPSGAGRLVAFLYVWMAIFVLPMTAATGYLGFAQYAGYLVPAAATPVAQHAIALAVGVVVVLALARPITAIARTALVLGAIALVTLVVVAFAGFVHPTQSLAHILPAAASLGGLTPAAFGSALIIALYDYAGYTGITQVGDEVIAPTRTIPRAIVASVLLVAAAYVLLNLGVFRALPIATIQQTTSVASLVVAQAFGPLTATIVTVAILITAFASTYGLLLGASRIPYAAALDGDFLPVFARLHGTHRYPVVALLTMGGIALPATLFSLDAAINALSAGAVLVAGLGSTLAALRARAAFGAAPFQVPLFPLPMIVSIIAWAYVFTTSGVTAMVLGLVLLLAGAVIYLARAHRARIWPFALATLVVLAAFAAPRADAATFTHTRIVTSTTDGAPQLQVDGEPYFFFAGAFFYERLPPERWPEAMARMRALGANTLDLYVPWNWHEVGDGQFDFDGHTNPRRNLRRVLALARQYGFHLIVRPGPVIRNEWRNGGYPAWLLRRPEYGMPLHDVLEGRYPATATLQNAHSDDAAAQWLANGTHRRYASRWLHAALHEFVPYADLVLAVALDDDQGAYIDNQTWPAPHLQRYLHWLDAEVRAIVGPTLPTFINTYDMKVPASAPVWAMGNWYQSDAYAIGEHDRVELDFATATLTTQEHVPLGVSEFQAGWLAAPKNPTPRAADPTNTTLALAEMLAWGAHGVVDFPLMDTLAPFGWEAPFSNAFYAWDAALPFDPTVTSARYAPTARFGDLVRAYGSQIARTTRVADIAIVDEISAGDPTRTTNDDVATIAARLKDELRACNERGLTCDVVDLRFSSDTRLARYRTIVVPPFVRAPEPHVAARLRALSATSAIVEHVPDRPGTGLTVLASRDAHFVVAVNWSSTPRTYGGIVDLGDGTTYDVPPFTVAARDATVLPVPVVAAPSPSVAERREPMSVRRAPVDAAPPCRVMMNATQAVPIDVPRVPPGQARVVDGHAFGSGDRTIALVNAKVVAVVVPYGGARLVALARIGDCARPWSNVTNATGMLRDDVLIQPPPSRTDRIAKYTHSYPAGTFNRPYRVSILASGKRTARVRFNYDMPDALPHGARFEKELLLGASDASLHICERATLSRVGSSGQRGIAYDEQFTGSAMRRVLRPAAAWSCFDLRP